MGSASDTVKRAVAYVRVSMMREDGISPDLQLASVRDWCHRHGYEITEVIEDLDVSGRFWRNRHIDDAIGLIETGQAEALVVWRWSRVSRDRYDWALSVARIEAAGGLLISATEDFDTETSVGRFVRGVLMEFAAFESDRIGDLWREVARRRVRHGMPSNGRPMFGYNKQPDGSYVPDIRTWPLLVESYQRYVDGESFAQIAAWLRRHKVHVRACGGTVRSSTPRLMTASSLARSLDSGFGAGEVRLRGEVYAGSQRPVVSAELWASYQAGRASRRQPVRPRCSRPADVFPGLVRCGHCGMPMTFKRGTRGDVYWCTRHRRTASTPVVYRTDRVDSLLYHWVSALADDPRRGAAARRYSSAYAAAAAQRATALTRAVSRDPHNATLRAELQAAESAALWRDPISTASVLAAHWHSLPFDLRADQLRRLVTAVSLRRRRGDTGPELVVTTTWGARTTIGGTPFRLLHLASEDGIRWLQPDEASRLVEVRPQVLRHWNQRGALPLTQTFARCHYYASTDLERFKRHRLPHACVRYDIFGVLEELAAPATDEGDGIPDRTSVQWLRPGQAADKLGVGTASLTRWNAAGALPHTRTLPRLHLYAASDIQRIRRHRRVDALGAWFDIQAVLTELEKSRLATSGLVDERAALGAREPV